MYNWHGLCYNTCEVMEMTKGYEQKKESNARYMAKMDRIVLYVPPEEKAAYKEAAELEGMSLTAFMRAAAYAYIAALADDENEYEYE